MEWVETSGSDIRRALSAALDQLGVDESEVDYEVLSEAKSGFLGIGKTEARIRARIRPRVLRSRDSESRKRHERRSRRGKKNSSNESDDTTASSVGSSDDGRKGRAAESRETRAANRTTEKSKKSSQLKATRPKKQEGKPSVEKEDRFKEVPLEEQGDHAQDFLEGFLDVLDVEGEVEVEVKQEDEIILANIQGDQLGHLIGPRGNTLQALQELTRTSVQRQTGASNGRIIVDISGYRKQRSEALGRFATQIAHEVLESGSSRTLEPMNPADRKVVHDAVNNIEGVETISEGEQNRRCVTIRPESE